MGLEARFGQGAGSLVAVRPLDGIWGGPSAAGQRVVRLSSAEDCLGRWQLARFDRRLGAVQGHGSRVGARRPQQRLAPTGPHRGSGMPMRVVDWWGGDALLTCGYIRPARSVGTRDVDAVRSRRTSFATPLRIRRP